MKLLPKRLKIKNIFPNLGSRITDKKFLLASFGSFSKTSVQSHRVSNSPEGRGKLDETRSGRNSYEKFGEKFHSDRTIPRYLHPDFFTSFHRKKGLFSSHEKNIQLCSNESTRLPFIELLISSKKFAANLN